MYFVDRKKIEETLHFLDSIIATFEEQKAWETKMEKLSLERIGHLMIESVLDVGNAMIDGFIMRDPGSYDDIIDILEDEKVITKEDAVELKAIIALRKNLVQDYVFVNSTEVVNVLSEHLSSMKSFSPSVKRYLENELGPVSAFKN
ncbi:DUF86 domain-containing protein [Bacillus timonensis]|nr:DUF86 domain-containing protein [Bacillus timonensis]